jgi:MFS family permease
MSTSPDRGAGEAQRHLSLNFIVHMAEGGLYIGGLAMVSADIVLPSMVKGLEGADWLVSLMPVVMMLGFTLPPIFTAHLVERSRRFKPLCLVSGVFQRLPYLAAGLILIFGPEDLPWLALAAVALAPLVSGLAGGTTLTAWQQLIIKTVPIRRRPILFGLRDVMSCLLGVGAGVVVATVLGRWPGRTGYGVLYLLTFGVLVVSYAVFVLLREDAHDPAPPEQHVGLWRNVRAIPEIVRGNRQFRLFLLTGMFGNGFLIIVPFMAIHAREVLDKPMSYVGYLLTAQMIGAILGNLVSGYLGSRMGCKAIMIASRVLLVASAAGAMLATSEWTFGVAFFLFGVGLYSHRVSRMSMQLEIVPRQRRATYLAITSLVGVPSMLAAAGICTLIRSTGGSFALTAAVTMASLLVSIWFLIPLRNPRR